MSLYDCGDCPTVLGCHGRCMRARERERVEAERRGQLLLPLGGKGSAPKRAAGGYAVAAKMTPQQRQERARKGAAQRKANARAKHGLPPTGDV